jgi:hypothetical protein
MFGHLYELKEIGDLFLKYGEKEQLLQAFKIVQSGLSCQFICRSKGEMLTASVVQWTEFLATHPVVWVRFPALPDFLSSGS